MTERTGGFQRTQGDGHIHCGHVAQLGHIVIYHCCRCGAETKTPLTGWEIGK